MVEIEIGEKEEFAFVTRSIHTSAVVIEAMREVSGEIVEETSFDAKKAIERIPIIPGEHLYLRMDNKEYPLEAQCRVTINDIKVIGVITSIEENVAEVRIDSFLKTKQSS